MIEAWHFVGDTLRDGRPVPADGETLIHDGPLEMCRSGLHASVRLIDAIQYALKTTLCLVECGGTMVEGVDKLVCSSRTILWRLDAETILRAFARHCALDVAHLWDMPPTVRQYLDTGEETIRDASWWEAASCKNAPRAAAWHAARDAAQHASRAEAWAAARDASREAAKAAFWGASAGFKALDAAADAQNKHLTAIVEKAHAQ